MHELTRRGNYQKYLNRNPLQRFLIWYFHRWVNELLGASGATTFVDVGCGEGFTVQRFLSAHNQYLVHGVDRDFPALLGARRTNPGIVFLQGDVESLPFAAGSFDAVLCLEVLEHLADPIPALSELRRVTSKYCLLSVPNEPLFSAANFLRGKNARRLGSDAEHVQKWSARQFVRMIAAHFQVQRVVYPFPWVMILCTK